MITETLLHQLPISSPSSVDQLQSAPDRRMDQFLEQFRQVILQSRNPDLFIAVLSGLIAWIVTLGLRMLFG